MKVLVSVASRHGSTREIGGAISAVLRQAGLEVDRCDPQQVESVDPYDAVIIGSGVYAGRWLAPARSLVEREMPRLLERPVWLFSSGPIGNPPKPTRESEDGVALRDRTRAVDHQIFEGKLDRRALGFGEKAVVSAVRAPAGDYRPWDAVLEWARWIALTLGDNARPAPETKPQAVAGGVVL